MSCLDLVDYCPPTTFHGLPRLDTNSLPLKEMDRVVDPWQIVEGWSECFAVSLLKNINASLLKAMAMFYDSLSGSKSLGVRCSIKEYVARNASSSQI